MATESLAAPSGPMAFAGFDSGVYAGWIAAVSDLMMCGRMDGTDPTTPRDLGGLLYSLTQAMQERQAAEREELRSARQ